MKKYSKKVKIVTAIITIIMIIGIAITLTIGLNYSLKYQESKKIELYVEKEFETSDIKQIAKEVLQNDDVIIQKVEVYGDSVSIIAKNITDEQKESLITKINEKYGTELSADSTQIQTIPSTRGRDIVKQYIEDLSIGIANLINIFEPEAIGIGGSFVYFEEVLLNRLKTEIISKNILFNPRENIIVKTAILENDAGIIGATL